MSSLDDVIHRHLTVHADHRGSVREAYRQSWFPGVPPVVQVVHSESKWEVFRGMHAHKRQFDIWHFTSTGGYDNTVEVFLYDHTVDAFTVLGVSPGDTIVIPPGISHGFYAPRGCTLTYYLTEEYTGTDEYEWNAYTSRWSGEDALPPISVTVMSDRDRTARTLEEFKAAW